MSIIRIFIANLAVISISLANAGAQDTRPALPEPTLVSLNFNDAAPDAVLDELSRQTGYLLNAMNERQWKVWASTAPTISISLDRVPFWQALRELCAKAGLNPYGYGYGSANPARTITLMPQQQGMANLMKCPASMSGPFMIIATSVNRSSYADLSRPEAARRSLSLQLMAFVEPKLKVVRVAYTPDVERAVDEKGNSLVINRAGQPQQLIMTPARGSSWSLSVPLQWPRDMGDRIAVLKGAVRVSLQTRSETLDIGDVMKAREARKMLGDFEVTFKQLTKLNDRQWQAEISIARQGDLDQKMLSDFMSRFSARLTDEQEGREYLYYGNPWYGQPAGGGAQPVGVRVVPGGGAGEVVVGQPGERAREVRVVVRRDGDGERLIVGGERAGVGGGDAPALRAPPVAPLANPYDMKLQFYYPGAEKPTGEPTRLVLELITETQELAVPFEFQDITLP